MALAQQAAAHAAEMQAAQQSLKATDAAYIGWAGLGLVRLFCTSTCCSA